MSGTYRDRIEPSKRVQRVDKTCNEANDVIVPTGSVHPGLEDEFTVVMLRSFSGDSHHEDEPTQLEIEHCVDQSVCTRTQHNRNSRENLLIRGRKRLPNIITADVRTLNP